MILIDVLLAITLLAAVAMPLLILARSYRRAAADPWVELALRVARREVEQ